MKYGVANYLKATIPVRGAEQTRDLHAACNKEWWEGDEMEDVIWGESSVLILIILLSLFVS